MADPSNPSFEDQGALPGQADSWSEDYSSGAEDVAEFGAGPRNRPYEGFIGGWGDNHQAVTGFSEATAVAAMFESGGLAFENFETSWGAPQPFNHQSVFTFDPGNFEAATFDDTPYYTPEDFEDFEEGWDTNESWEANWAAVGVSSTAATFDDYLYKTPESVEDFEEVWQDNENAEDNFDEAGVSKTAALFDSGTNAFEDFEGSWTSML
jgi:hypothetical protein